MYEELHENLMLFGDVEVNVGLCESVSVGCMT